MSALSPDQYTLAIITEDPIFDEAQLAAAAFLARYSGRTLDAYRYDLRTFFQWAARVGLSILEANEQRGEVFASHYEIRRGEWKSTSRRS